MRPMGERLAMPGCRAEYAVSWGKEFLSTPSARRATWLEAEAAVSTGHFYPRPPRGGRLFLLPLFRYLLNFYPRPPRGGRLCDGFAFFHPVVISIHALREEGDISARQSTMICFGFLSTPSARRATWHILAPSALRWISIHALREEGDHRGIISSEQGMYFYPRPPRGGRRIDPARRSISNIISIHALREEGDPSRQ